MNQTIFLGIDPGLSGAVAAIHPDGRVELFDVPTVKAKVGQKFIAGEMADLLRPFGGQAFCVVETAEAPRLGSGREASGNVTSALKIGYGAGIWEGILASHSIAYEMVAARIWKRPFGLIGCDKKASRARACELFPAVRAELARRRPDFSEALLLAETARRKRSP